MELGQSLRKFISSGKLASSVLDLEEERERKEREEKEREERERVEREREEKEREKAEKKRLKKEKKKGGAKKKVGAGTKEGLIFIRICNLAKLIPFYSLFYSFIFPRYQPPRRKSYFCFLSPPSSSILFKRV